MTDVSNVPSGSPDTSVPAPADAIVDGESIETTVEPIESPALSTGSDVPPVTPDATPSSIEPSATPLVSVDVASPSAFDQTTDSDGNATPDTITAPTNADAPNGPEAIVTPVAEATDVTPEVAINAAGETPSTMTVDPNLPIVGDGPTSDAPTIPDAVTDPDSGQVYQAPADSTLATNADTPAQVDPSPAKPETYTREFNVYRELSDDEVNVYSAGTVREAHQLGLRPTHIEVTSTVDEGDYPADTADADKPHTYVFVASADGGVTEDPEPEEAQG